MWGIIGLHKLSDGATRLFYLNCRWISLEHCVDHFCFDLINELVGGWADRRYVGTQVSSAWAKIVDRHAGNAGGVEFFIRHDHTLPVARNETAVAQT